MPKRSLILSALLAFTLGFSSARAATDAMAEHVRLTLQTRNGQSTFHIGELISLQLAYSLSSASAKPYLITNANYDRSGRLGIERFQVEPASGWDDPLKLYFQSFSGFMGGGLSSSAKLTPVPVVISRPLNEWVRFGSPGRYRLTVISTRVQSVDHTIGSPPQEVRSNEISLTIIPATPEWQKATLEAAVTTLDGPTSGKGTTVSLHEDQRSEKAAAVLRYLGTPGAAREMARRLDDQTHVFQFMLGLASTPARDATVMEMQRLLHDPAFPVTQIFLQTLSLVALSRETVTHRAEQRLPLEQNFERELLGALATKQGQALARSAYTIVDAVGMHSGELPAEEKRQLTALLVNAFDILPISEQVALLQHRWRVLDHEAMRPLLPKLAERYTDFAELREVHAYEANQLSASALLHWWEMDPTGARPAIIREILRPHPRFGEEVLGILPDKTLPEVEQHLADRLASGTGHAEQVAALVSRYATPSVEPQIVDYLQTRVGRLACAVQTPLLAYLLRVDPVGAASFFQRAMAARGAGFSACNHFLLVEVASLHNDLLLQEIATASLNDTDPQVAANAANYLGTYGTAAAEAPLWARLADWSSQWKGRAAELRYVPGESTDGTNQAGLGSNLITALGAGQGWLTSEINLTRLLDLSVTPDQRSQVEQLLRAWKQQPKQIQFIAFGKGQFQIAQYHANSLEAATEKLRQFPSGTEFVWAGPSTQDDQRKAYEEVSNAIKSSGIIIRVSPQPQ